MTQEMTMARRTFGMCAALVLSGCVGMGGGKAPRAQPQRYDLGPSPVTAPIHSADMTLATQPPSGSVAARVPTGTSTPPASGPASRSGAVFPPPLVLSMDAAPILADTGMLWRVGDSAAPQAYAQARWAATPVQLVQQRLLDYLSAQRHVVTESTLVDVAQLRVTLTRFEQVFTPDGKSSQAHVGLQAMLMQDRRVLDATRINTQAPAATQNAEGGVQALRQATDLAARQLADWINGQRLPAHSR